MKAHSFRGLVAALSCLALAHIAGPDIAHADPVTDQNAGTWVDLYDDSNGIAPAISLIGGQVGQANIVRDPTSRAVTLTAGAPNGSWFTSEIAPASFDAWKSLYIDYSSSGANQVQVEVWDVTAGNGGATKVLGPLSPSASDDPAYTGKVSLASVSANAKRLRIRVLLATGTIPPTVSALKATFNPLSVLQASLDAPATRLSGDSIQLRMPVSVSFVNATSYVAYLTVTGWHDDLYTQSPVLTFETATLGGLYTATAITVSGVNIPARSVYWNVATQQAGQTFAYNASFRSPNGLVKGISLDFQGKVFASNAATFITPTKTTVLDAKPRSTFSKYAGGTFVIGGVHYARNTGSVANRTITLSVAPTNWWSQPIPSGAQSYFAPVVWDSFQDFITKGVATAASVTPQNGGIKTLSGTTLRGVIIPANSVYWDLATMAPGARLDLRYSLVVETTAPLNTTVNACGAPSTYEAWLATPQESVVGVNACTTGECARRSACLPIKIGVNDSPGYSFAKGDQINGSLSVSGGNNDDNPLGYITWGQAVDFKLAVGNSSLARLDDVVIYDYVKPTWSLLAASVPSGAGPPDVNNAPTVVPYGRVWYRKTRSATMVPLYSSGSTVDATNWQSTPPAVVSPATPGDFYVAYEIDSLRSSYCSLGFANGITNCTGYEPTSVMLDFSVLPIPGNACDGESPLVYITNSAEARVGSAFGITGNSLTPPGNITDTEKVQVKPLKPDLTTSSGSGSGSLVPGTTATHTFYVQNRNVIGNPVDTARNVVATMTVPSVTANGIQNVKLEVSSVSAPGATLAYTYDGNGALATITATWPSILPNSFKTATISYVTPTGIKNLTSFQTTATIRADDDCGIPMANVSASTSIFSEPVLTVDKDLDFRVVNTGTPVTYTLTYQNTGTSPSEKTWVIDRLDDASRITGAKIAVGEVWFSDDLPPFSTTNPTTQGLPNALIPSFQFTDAVVRAHFTPATGAADGQGFRIPPAGTKWVAFLVDNSTVGGVAVSPRIFPTGLAQKAYVRVEVVDPNSIGQLVVNEPAIIGDTLEQAIGNRVNFIVSPDPGIELAKSCNEVVANNETVTYSITFRNDTTNPDSLVDVEDILPLNFVLESANPNFDSELIGTDGRRHLLWHFTNLVPSATLQEIVLVGHFNSNVVSGTTLRNEVLATATNSANTQSFFDDCPTRIQNTELSISKLVDNPAPISGAEVTYTLSVTNHTLRSAEHVKITDVLPTVSVPGSVSSPLTYVAGSLQAITPGWAAVNFNPATMTFDIQKTGLALGLLPGALTPTTVRFQFRAKVAAAVGAGKQLTNRADVTNTVGEDGTYPNTNSVVIKTPWPDPYVSISSTPVVKPGEIATWTILFGNASPEIAKDTVVYFTMPAGPNNTPANQTDFTFATTAVPAGTRVFYSTAAINVRPAFDVNNPTGSGAWSSTATGIVNHIAFLVKTCDTVAPLEACEDGDIYRNDGPYTILVKATAREPGGALPAIGGSFTGTAQIAMLDLAFQDNDPTNNGPVTATVVTPGVGIAVEALCDPSGGFPGLAPGDTTTFTFAFRNNGTTPDYGVSFLLGLDARLEYLADDATTVEIVDSTGQSVTPLGTDGSRVQTAPPWTRVGNVFTLGPLDTATSYALAPGDSGTITVTARVKSEVADDTDIANTVRADIEGRPSDADELNLDDNIAGCGTTVYRADVFVFKTMTNKEAGKTYADGDDNITVTIEYNNGGHFDAREVKMTDSLVEGLTFVTGSVRGVPEGALVEYANGAGAWGYTPVGVVDPNVRGVRIRYPDGVAMPAPAGTYFSQTSAADFAAGSHDNTTASTQYQAVLVAPSGSTVGTARVVPFSLTSAYTGSGFGLFYNTPFVIQIAYAREEFSGPIDIGSISFRSQGGAGSGGTKTFSDLDIEVAILNPASRPNGVGSTFSMSTNFATNMGQRRTQVHDGPYTMNALGTYREFTYELPFSKAFHYDPAEGDLVVLLRLPASGAAVWSVENALPPATYNTRIATVATSGALAATAGNVSPDYQPISRLNVYVPTLGVGTYTSPKFPTAGEGKVLDWGRLIVNAAFDDNATNETMSIDVLNGSGALLKNYLLDQGTDTYTFDLSEIAGLDPAIQTELQLRANFKGGTGICAVDIAPSDLAFAGLPSALHTNGTLVGWTNARNDYLTGFAAWAWTKLDGVMDLHGLLDGNTGATDAFSQSLATDIDAAGKVVGFATQSGVGTVPSACIVPSGEMTVPNIAPGQLSVVALDQDRTANGQAETLYTVYDKSLVSDTPVTIYGLRLKVNPSNTTPGRTYHDFKVDIGYTQSPQVDLSLYYQPRSFFTGTPQRVYDAAYTAVFSVGATADYDLYIPFSSPFTYNPASGHLAIIYETTSAAPFNPTGAMFQVALAPVTSGKMDYVLGKFGCCWGGATSSHVNTAPHIQLVTDASSRILAPGKFPVGDSGYDGISLPRVANQASSQNLLLTYTKAEIGAAGVTTPISISKLRFRAKIVPGGVQKYDIPLVKIYAGQTLAAAPQVGQNITATLPMDASTLVFSGTLSFDFDAIANNYDLLVTPQAPFIYYPAKGDLALVISIADTFNLSTLNFTLDCKPGQGAGTHSYSTSTTSVIESTGTCPLAMEIEGVAQAPTRFDHNDIVWTDTGPSWTSQCLPLPTALAADVSFSPHAPITNGPHANANNIIAGIADNNTGFGTPIAWCPSGQTYLANTLTVREPNAVGGFTTSTKAAVISDIDDNNYIIGGYRYGTSGECRVTVPVVWVPNSATPCISGWTGVPLMTPTVSQVCTPESHVAVGINAQHDIVVSSNVAPVWSFYRYGDTVWFSNSTSDQLRPPRDYAFAGQDYLSIMGTHSDSVISSFRVTTPQAAGLASIAYNNGAFTALPANSVPTAFTPGGDILGMDVVSAATTTMWTYDGTTRKTITRLAGGRNFGIPMQANAGGLIAGADFNFSSNVKTQLQDHHGRVWTTQECGGASPTPRLLDWKVVYTTDRNPSWGFDVQVADICTTNLPNSADISTATPEISTSNNSSSTSISVNTADLAVSVSLGSNVITQSGSLGGTATLSNLGPGTAEDVNLVLQVPDSCALQTYNLVTTATVSSNVRAGNKVTVRLASLPANGTPSKIDFTCSATAAAGTALAINAAVTSPTIDCSAGNDAASETAVVGSFPNLWTTITGPTGTTVGSATPYTIGFGNNGNVSGAGTIVVPLPAGTTYGAVCNQAPCPPTGVNVVVVQPTTNAAGSLTFTPTAAVGNTFTAGSAYTIPFTLTWSSCAAAATTAVLTATVTPTGSDSNFADNTASTSTFVSGPTGELALSVSRSDTTVETNKELFYTIHYSNVGSQAAIGTELEFHLPVGLTLQSVIPAGYSAAGQVISVGRGTTVKSLLPSDIGSVVVRAKVTGAIGAAGTATLRATAGACAVTAPIAKPTLATAETGLHVIVSPSIGSACGDDNTNVTWTVTVTNPAETASATSTIALDVPASLTYVAGSIQGQGATVAGAHLSWSASIPANGALSFTFQTRVNAVATGVVSLAASAGAFAGEGSLLIDCGERVVVTKAWDLTCGLQGDTFDVTVSITNKTDTPVRGTLTDTFQAGVTAAGMDLGNNKSVAVDAILPGATWQTTFQLAVGAPLLYGHPIFDQVVFDSNTTVATASNQVAGAMIACAAPAQCHASSCEPLLGCTDLISPPNPNVAERCDNSIDDNCNGTINELPDGALPIGTTCDGNDDDLCVNGLIICDPVGHTTSICNETLHFTELCNGVDDNCKAGIDEGFNFNGIGLGLACDGDDVGTCTRGTVACNGTFTAAICNETGSDPTVQTCSVGTGVCKRDGHLTCAGACDAPVVLPTTAELCGNTLDDNCNGSTDEGFATVGNACNASNENGGADTDLCLNDVIACSVDRLSAVCTPTVYAVETCNGTDDNCNGTPDELWPTLDQQCDGLDSDLCLGGVIRCNSAHTGIECSDDSNSIVESCNGLDDNCDGTPDEGFTFNGIGLGLACDGDDVGTCTRGTVECNGAHTAAICNETGTDPTIQTCSVGLGVCKRDGHLTCAGVCDAAVVTPTTAELCGNALDDNCNGTVDEGFATVGNACNASNELGVGTPDTDLCLNDVIACSVDLLTASCKPTVYAAETCNGADDNCNGAADELWPTLDQVCDGLDTDLCPNGVIRCNSAHTGIECSDDENSTAEACNGADDNCNGDVDEGFAYNGIGLGFACDGDDVGTCARGTVTCNGAETAAICNETGSDPTSQTCSVGLGVCKRDGHLTCAGVCDAAVVLPTTPELCGNVLDDDCDGNTDEGFATVGNACNAIDELGVATPDTDRCLNDVIACSADRLTAVCKATVYAVETCNGADDNCNGASDELWPTLTQACDGLDTDLCKGGVIQCNSAHTGIECSDDANSIAEACNGVDDNCDGRADEGFAFNGIALGQACDGNDVGTCTRGIVQCNPGNTAAICNETGTDPTSQTCTVGLGECKRDGHLRCDSTCDAAVVTPGAAELCGDGKDNDCDGDVDEGFERLDQACDATGEATPDTDKCNNDIYACSLDKLTMSCKATTYAVETCNSKDDNCDGTADEGYLFQGIALGQPCDGADADKCNGGQVACNGGGTAAECTDDAASAVEACNGLDDDCDGKIDELWTQAGFDDNQTVFTGPYLGTSCDGSNDVDLCKLGKIECNLDFTGTYCHEQDLGVAELCNGQDDECECGGQGQPACTTQYIDEGFDIGASCEVGLGACLRTGTIACTSTTASGCDAAVVTGIAESCNAIDDDCDGITDDPADAVCKSLETDILTGPPALTSSTAASFTYVNPLSLPVAAHTTFECKLDGGAWVTCNHTGATPNATYTNLPQGQHTLLVRATRGDGAVDETPDFWSWVIDTTLPDTTILSGPANPSQSPTGTFVFGSPTPNPDFYSCMLDPAGGICPATGAGSYAECPESFVYTALADGTHTICVYVTNTVGTPDPLPASYTWIIDTTAPETEIVATIPPELTSSTSIVLNYVDPTAPTTNTFECSLDGATWADCDGKTVTYTTLSEGPHTFDVRTIDPNGVIDPTPATFSWVIDRTAPCPTIATQPADPAQSDTAIFGFTASEANVGYFCALDPMPAQLGPNGEPLLSAYTACAATVSYDGLADGTHKLWVYAKDGADNVGTCRASYTWLIDTRYPETEITAGPTPLIGTGEVPVFDYVDPTDEDLITFECALDGGTFERCDGVVVGDGGTTDFEDVAVGTHIFTVRACDFTKAEPVQCDPTPASWTFEVTTSPCPNDHTSPVIDCANDMVLECKDGGATLDLTKLTPTATDACAPIGTTTSAAAEIGLGPTPVVFTSVDGNGNLASCVTMVDVQDKTAPVITCPADQLTVPTDPGVCNATLDIAAATAVDSCQGSVGILFVDDAPTAFIPGETTVTHRALDAYGNEAFCTQKVVVVDDEPLVLTCSESLTVDADADKCEWTGVSTALATDNCSDELTVEVNGTYPIGESPILFTAADAAGNADECTTKLTVRDVTKPIATCGSAVGAVPTVIRATGTDACSALVTIENVVCTKVVDGTSSSVPLANCPVVVTGDTIEINGRLTDGELTITYDVKAIDPSGNIGVANCVEAYDPDQDGDGIIDAEDICVLTPNADQSDIDDDGVGDLCDVCPATADPDQADVDDDGVGDACSDRDDDGVLDATDNCPDDANPGQSDADDDTLGDACDAAPYEGLTAEGSGGCATGNGGLVGGLGVLALLALAARRRRHT